MSAVIEKQIVDMFQKLDLEAQQRVIDGLINPDAKAEKSFDMTEWLERARESVAQLREKLGEGNYVGTDEMLRELREERSWPASW